MVSVTATRPLKSVAVPGRALDQIVCAATIKIVAARILDREIARAHPMSKPHVGGEVRPIPTTAASRTGGRAGLILLRVPITGPLFGPRQQSVECRTEILPPRRQAILYPWRYLVVNDAEDDAICLQLP